MNKLLVQNTKAKFIQNLIYCQVQDSNIVGSILNNNLYQIYYSYNPTHVIFSADNITPEISQFISDFSTNIKCFIFHDQINLAILNNFESFPVYNITNAEITNPKNNNIIYPKNMINSQLFYKTNNLSKHESMVCFLDNQAMPNEKLNNYLYPNTKLPIKLFNNVSGHNYQNLGVLNERQKAKVLQNNKYYLSLENNKSDYCVEASVCGCHVVSLENIEDYQSVPYNDPPDTIEYQTFIKERILI